MVRARDRDVARMGLRDLPGRRGVTRSFLVVAVKWL